VGYQGGGRGDRRNRRDRKSKNLYHRGHGGTQRTAKIGKAKTSEVYAKLGSGGIPREGWGDRVIGASGDPVIGKPKSHRGDAETRKQLGSEGKNS